MRACRNSYRLGALMSDQELASDYGLQFDEDYDEIFPDEVGRGGARRGG